MIISRLWNQIALGALAGIVPLSTCASTGSISGQVILKDQKGNVVEDASNVVVFIDGQGLDKYPHPAKKLSMASQGKAFVPNIIATMKGGTVDFPNEDKIYHNSFSLSKTKPFDLGLYKKGAKGKSVIFDQTGLVKVYCNIHENMVGYIVVLDNPFYSLTDKKGKFHIKGLPEGDYIISAWHRLGDIKKKKLLYSRGQIKVDLRLTKDNEVKFQLVEKKVYRKFRHLNKWGKPYKSKY